MTTTEQRNQRVMEYLHDLYGHDPEPLRSYLDRSEAHDLTASSTIGRLLTIDLDLRGYGGKWRKAVEDQIRAGKSSSDWDFWYSARLAFLEYGGCYNTNSLF